ncbi:MAG: 30S ribosomal protein S3 [Candidatus Aenigmarchaeota archaeon]|nr:30S ribosomal protein S3 [Candidatus Aenigmarchaeota archaeon]
MKERLFIKKAKEQLELEEFIRKQFHDAKCGDIEIQHTPVVVRIIIHTTTPGLIIGSGGERIKEIIDIVKDKYKIENPQIDVQKIDEPDLDPGIVAQSIAASIENGTNVKRLGKFYLQRVMDAGAIGCEIVFAGKFGGQRGKVERFIDGYLKKCGEPARRDVMKGFAVANPKLGNTGVTVKIMLNHPEMFAKVVRKEENEEVKKEEKVEKKKETPIETDTAGEDHGNTQNEEAA